MEAILLVSGGSLLQGVPFLKLTEENPVFGEKGGEEYDTRWLVLIHTMLSAPQTAWSSHMGCIVYVSSIQSPQEFPVTSHSSLYIIITIFLEEAYFGLNILRYNWWLSFKYI